MNRIMLGLLCGLLFITACAGTPPLTQPTTDSVSKTSTPSPLPSSTPTIMITSTETLETDSCIPKSTIDGSQIGLRTPPDLDNIIILDTLLIKSGDDFSIGLDLILEGHNQYIFWLEMFCDNQDGQRFTEVVDEIILRPLNENEFAVTTCNSTHEVNNHVVAIGYHREVIISGATHIKVIATQAWLIDLDNWTFIEIPKDQLRNVICVYEAS